MKFSNKNKSGFTIVELLVTIVVIAILASIVIASSNKLQIDAINDARTKTISQVAGALEKYYSKNGEYPGEQSLINTVAGNSGEVVAKRLGTSQKNLIISSTPTGVSNAIIAGTTGTPGTIVYEGTPTAPADPCQNSPTGGCSQFVLRYVFEGGAAGSISSMH